MDSPVLFIGYGDHDQEELRTFMESRNDIAYFVQTTEDAIHILDEKPVNTVVLIIHNLKDAAILKYINRYYPEKEVVVSASKEYNEIINVFSKGHFTVMKQPFRLNELVSLLY